MSVFAPQISLGQEVHHVVCINIISVLKIQPCGGLLSNGANLSLHKKRW